MAESIRQQLCSFNYSELAELAARLTGTAETVRNPAVAVDLHQAAGAVSDLASTRFAIEEIATALLDKTFHAQDGNYDTPLYKFATETLEAATELLAAIGKPVES